MNDSPSATTASDRGVAADLASRFERETTELQTRLKEVQQLQRFTASVAASEAAAHPSEALRLLSAGDKQLKLLAKYDPAAAADVDRRKAALRSEVEEQLAELPATLPAAVAAVGLELDPASRHPNYSFLEGLIELKFDKSKLEATLLPRDGRRLAFAIDPAPLAAHIKAEADRLTGRPFDAEEFLARISTAYQTVKRSALSGDGGISLKELVAELAKSKDFRADEFNVDLSRLLRDEASVGRIWLDNTRDPKNGLLLWKLDQRGYYGYMRMEDT